MLIPLMFCTLSIRIEFDPILRFLPTTKHCYEFAINEALSLIGMSKCGPQDGVF